jgi:signal transduction histidine kinase
LHDETLQGLGALRVLLASALRRRSPGVLEGSVESAISALDQEIQNLRGLIAELRPAALDELGVAAALRGLAERTATAHGLAVDAELSLPEGRPHPERGIDLDATVYRVVQEALSNVAKHSRAERVRLSVVERDGSIEVSIEDDGVGFDPDLPEEGFGLLGMRERVAMAGGSLAIDSAPGTGTRIKAVIPR